MAELNFHKNFPSNAPPRQNEFNDYSKACSNIQALGRIQKLFSEKIQIYARRKSGPKSCNEYDIFNVLIIPLL